MEEVSISEIEKTADTLEENDLLLISQYNTDGSFDSAKISGKNLKQKLPGLMVRMFNCHNAQLEKPYDGREVINNLSYKTQSFTWYESRTSEKTEVLCETAIGPLATNGCSMLYKRTKSNDRYFHDWYNNSDFWFYAGSYDSYPTGTQTVNEFDVPDEKVCVYDGKIKLAKGNTIRFKGHVDNFASIIINGNILCDFVGYNEEEIDCSFTAPDDKLYYDFKLIITNYGTNGPGFENDFPQYSDLMMSLDDGTTWLKISNESFAATKELFFLPSNCDEYDREAQDLRDQGAKHKPGLLIKMWHTDYTVGKLSASCIFDHETIDKVEPRDFKILNAVDVSGTKYDLDTYAELDATSGCEMLYYRLANRFSPYFFDWFNGKNWNYYAGGGDLLNGEERPLEYDRDPRDKKVVAYFGDIYLPEGQKIYFKGLVDDSLSILIDDEYVTSNDTDHIPLKGLHYTTTDAARTFVYQATYTGYHKFKAVACNCACTAGPRPEVTNPSYTNTIKLSFDNLIWYRLSNEGVGRNIFFIPEGTRYDEIYQKAVINRDNIEKKKLPGMLVHMWSTRLPNAAYARNNFNPNVIDFAPPGIGSIAKALTYSGTDYTVNTFKDLNVTSGCGMLYKTSNTSDTNYYDWYNGLKWNFASEDNGAVGTTTHVEKLAIYYTQIYLHKGQTICFKGIPDDTLSILIDNTYPTDSAGNQLKYITCIEDAEAATYTDPETIFKYTASTDKYYTIRIIVTNKGGPGGYTDSNNGVVISFDGGTTWFKVTNDTFSNPYFFIPDDEEYTQLWYDAERSRERNNHYIDFDDKAKVYNDTNGNTHTWVAGDSGTFIIAVGGTVPSESDRAVVYASMPPGDSPWVEIAKFAPHHGGGWQSNYCNVNIAMAIRVARGTKIKIENLKTKEYDNCQVFRDVDSDYASIYSTISGFHVRFLNGYNGGLISENKLVAAGTKISSIKPANPTRDATAQYSYSFNGWDAADSTLVTSDMTVNAKWKSTVRSYDITFKNNGGTQLAKTSYQYGQTPAYSGTPVAENQEAGSTYTFTGWNPSIASVTGAATYTATYSKYTPPKTYYSVKFYQHRNSTSPFKTLSVEAGTTPTLPDATESPLTGWTRNGWGIKTGSTPAGSAVYENVEYYGEYTANIAVATTMSGNSTNLSFTGYTLPTGLNLCATKIAGSIKHSASPNHKVQMTAFAAGSTYATDNPISEWDEVTAQASNTFNIDLNDYCGGTTVESDDDRIWWHVEKTATCSVSWTFNLTMTVTLS